MMGLKRTHWIDERRDPIKATVCCCRISKRSFRRVRRLALSVGRIQRRARTRPPGHRPRRHQRLLAARLAPRNEKLRAALHGRDHHSQGSTTFLVFEPQAEEPAFAYEEVVLPEDWPYVDLKAAAQLLGIERQVLHDLNPELRQGHYAAGEPLALCSAGGRPASAGYCSTSMPVCRSHRRPRSISTECNAAIRSLASPRPLASPRGSLPRPIALETPTSSGRDSLLYIPVAPRAKPASGRRGTYTVRPNDVLGRIASQHGVSLRDLMKWNGLKTTLIKPGQELVVRQQPCLPRGDQRRSLYGAAGRYAVGVGPEICG